jgi:phage protein D
MKVPKAAWKVTLNGVDLTDKIAPRLLALTLTEKREDEADELELTLDDGDGKLDIPAAGATLRVFLGWESGDGVPIGLVDKGTFHVDEASWSAPPDVINVRGRSAKFTDVFRVRRERAYVNATLAQVLGDIAAANGLTARIDAALGAQTVTLGHGAISDAALLNRLGKRFDATATIKADFLLFNPIGKGKTATGAPIPAETIDRSQTTGASYERAERDQYDGAEAVYHDKGTATRHTVSAGGGGSGPAKRLRRVYANEAHAQQAADAENCRMKRAGVRLELPLALGRPDLYPDRPITVTGFKAEIDAKAWLIAEAQHSMDSSGGAVTRLTLEAASKDG